MEILKGMVRDAGYPDVECTYGKVDDNTMYYFVEAGQLPNGNIIASTVLKEAIGHAPHTSLGVIDRNGKIIIPFENKNIRQVRSKFLLVEKNIPTTKSVIDALKIKDDPMQQENIQKQETDIKEQLIGAMGMNGDFIFANMFSEATVYTFDGLNVSGGYFSYISELDGNYYFTSNVVGSQIIKFNPDMLEEQQMANMTTSAAIPENNTENTNTVEEISNTSEEIPNVEGENVNSPITDQVDSSPLNIPSVSGIAGGDVVNSVVNTEQVSNEVSQNENNIESNVAVPQVDIPVAANTEEQNIGYTAVPVENEESIEQEPIATEQVESGENNNIELPQVDIPVAENTEEQNTGYETMPVESEESMEPESTNTEQVENKDDSTVEIPNIPLEESGNTLQSGSETDEEQEEEVESKKEDSTDLESEDTSIEEDNQFNLEEEMKNIEENDDEAESTESEEETEEETSDEETTDDGTDNDSEEEMDEELNNDEVNEDTSEEVEDEEEEKEPEDNKTIDDPYEKLSHIDLDEEDITNPVILNATTTIKKLLDENRNQREIIDKQAGELEAIKTSYGILSEDNKSKEKEIYTLHKKMVEYRTKANAISRENVRLKSSMMKQSELMQNIEKENKSLREQVAGIHALGSAVAEANVLVEPLDYSSFSNELEESFDRAKSKIA